LIQVNIRAPKNVNDENYGSGFLAQQAIAARAFLANNRCHEHPAATGIALEHGFGPMAQGGKEYEARMTGP
jgi:hypothetical protein